MRPATPKFYPHGYGFDFQMNVRPAQESDFARVSELLENDGRPRIPHAEYTEYRQAYIDRLDEPDTVNRVAVDDGQIVGFCSIQFRARFNHMRPEAWIADLVVEPSARGRGAGRALLDDAEQCARDRDAWEIALESPDERKEAHLLYPMTGMEDAGRFFRKRL
jgi:GNAT superfamily N-acetyltransferase